MCRCAPSKAMHISRQACACRCGNQGAGKPEKARGLARSGNSTATECPTQLKLDPEPFVNTRPGLVLLALAMPENPPNQRTALPALPMPRKIGHPSRMFFFEKELNDSRSRGRTRPRLEGRPAGLADSPVLATPPTPPRGFLAAELAEQAATEARSERPGEGGDLGVSYTMFGFGMVLQGNRK